MTKQFHNRHEAWSAAATRLEARGLYSSAADILACAVDSAAPSERHRKRLEEIQDIIISIPAWTSQDRGGQRLHRSLVALGGLLDELISARNEVVPTNTVPKSVVMIIGCLGPGGSERQLLNTARGLQAIRAADSSRCLFGQIKVVVQSGRSRPHDGFFRSQLQLAGVPVIEYEELPFFGGCFESSTVRSVARTLKSLPLPVLEGVLRLSDALRLWRPDVVQIWQEPTVLESALAAILAGVPRIILSLRSVPAIDRPERYRPEYPLIFSALLTANNVSISCNSRFAAARYAHWLGIRPAQIAIIPNGVERLRTDSDDASQILFREFDRQTRDSRLTVGVVMRMDENKRPLLWVQAAESILEKFPSARFILVGDGQLRCQAINWVRKRGIDRRFLFVGVSHYVGFWLSKMDLFLLLSKREGLPNALIEAQLSGIPAVITPAGGAPEALLPGITGVITSPDPTAEEVATTVIELARKPDRLRIMGEVGVRWATESFSMARMLRETIALMAPDEQKLAGFDALPCVEDYTAEADAD